MDKLIIAMNKVDMFPEGGVKDPALQAQTKKLRARFKNTKFGAFLPIVPVAAAPRVQGPKQGEEESKNSTETNIGESYGVENLINTILMHIDVPNREVSKNQLFQFAIDHCF